MTHHFPLLEKPSKGTHPVVGIAERAAGFSLVEIMVALVIGMLSMIVMLQVFSVFEGQKRTTTGGDDAQNNGAIALYGLQRDVRQSGFGVSSYDLIGCNVLLRTGVTLNAMAPTTINHASIPAGDANTDTVLVVYGNAGWAAEGDAVISTPPANNNYPMQTPTSFVLNDRVIAEPETRPSPCNLILDTVSPAPVPPNVTVTTGVAGMLNGKVYNLGQTPKILVYAVRDGNLTVCDYMSNDCGDNTKVTPVLDSAVWVPIANDIISMRAQYGRDTDAVMDGIVNTWDQTTPTTACAWVKASALRIALVARNGQPEKTAVTAAAPAWEGSAGAAIDLTATTVPTGFTWQNFRYRVFQTAIPLRNITSMGVVSSCA